MSLPLVLVAGLAIPGEDGRPALLVASELRARLIARQRRGPLGRREPREDARRSPPQRGIGQMLERLAGRGIELIGRDRRPLEGLDERFRQLARTGQGGQQLAARRDRESRCQRSSALAASDGRPARPTARAAADWISAGCVTASKRGMIASARSGRPRASTSSATSRSALGRGETASADAAGQSGASRSRSVSNPAAAWRSGRRSGGPDRSRPVGQASQHRQGVDGSTRPGLRLT